MSLRLSTKTEVTELKKCETCDKPFEQSKLVEVGNLLDDSVEFYCFDCYNKNGIETVKVGDGIPQGVINTYNIEVVGLGHVQVDAHSKDLAFITVQHVEEFNSLLKEATAKNSLPLQVVVKDLAQSN